MARNYTPKTFNIPKLDGISKAQIDAHIKLYEGYVKHTNTIYDKVTEWLHNGQGNHDYEVKELWRRFGFEFDGMRNHEYYFGALVDGAKPFDPESAVGKAILEYFGSFEALKHGMELVSKTRGSGWTMLYFDPTVSEFIIGWADEHHLGILSTLPVIIALDCWEHAYMIDHDTTGRGAYVDAYFKNLNWEVIDEWYKLASGK